MNTILQGDCRTVLKTLPAQSVQCVVTSPPYFGLRDYGHADQIGLETTPQAYVETMREVFKEVWRVLKDDGTVWLNLGDSYAGGGNYRGNSVLSDKQSSNGGAIGQVGAMPVPIGLKPKDLIGIPWSVAKALQQPFYHGRIQNELDRVWLAATIDAEGSICGFHHTRKDDGTIRTGIHLTITNTNRMMLDNAYRIWPTSKLDHNNHGLGHFGKMDCWRWIAHDVDEKSELLRELFPYFVSKKKQALLAWNFLEMSRESKRLGKTQEAQKMKDKRSWIVHALTKLNHLESVDIPDWASSPPSLQADGWYLRSDIIWHKPNPMPESVTDRPTKSHEYLFLLSKNETYYYDAAAIAEPSSGWNGSSFEDERDLAVRPTTGRGPRNINGNMSERGVTRTTEGLNLKTQDEKTGPTRNKRSVWTVATSPYSEAHFATFPPDLIRPCILAGTKPGDTVLDPFFGAGTVGLVATEYGRDCIGIELNPDYIELARRRCDVTPGLPL